MKHIFLVSLLACIAFLGAWSCAPANKESDGHLIPAPAAKRLSQQQFGMEVGSLEVIQANFGEKEYLGDVLRAYAVDQATIDTLAARSTAVFDVRRMKAGHAYTILKDKDLGVRYFIYEKSKSELVVFELGENPRIFETHMAVVYRQREVSGEIALSLYESLDLQKANPRIALLLEDIYGSTLDFFRLKPGDSYKVIYEEAIVNGEVVGINRVIAAWIGHDQKDYYALGFEHNEVSGFFDETGRSLKRTLRRAPVKLPNQGKSGSEYAYNPGKPSSGVLYTLPSGTLVHALGEGKVALVKKSGKVYTVGLQHAHGLETTYLTLDQLAPGLKTGALIHQGQLLGKVLGPGKKRRAHLRVIYRHNGLAIGPDEAMSLAIEVVPPGQMAEFESVKQTLLRRLSAIPLGRASIAFADL